MKIGFITTKMPALQSGTQVRNYHLLRSLQEKYQKNILVISALDNLNNHDIDNYKNNFNGDNTYFVKIPILQLGNKIRHTLNGEIPYLKNLSSIKLDEKIIKQILDVDILILQELDSYALIKNYIHEFKGKIIMDAHNIDAKRFKAEVSNKPFFEKIVGKLFINTFIKYEIEAVKKCDYLLVCSEIDKSYFSKFKQKNKIFVIPNGVDCKYFSPRISSLNNKLVFMGLLSYLPNITGLRWYLTEIHRLVKKEIPNIELTIIGKNPPLWLLDFAKKNPEIKITNFVEDVRTFISEGAVSICPLKDGSGTRLKILEYMAMGKPVVSTSVGAEGLDVENNKNIILADSAKDFASSVVTLLHNRNFANKISKNGRRLVVNYYDWSKIKSKYIGFIQKA